MKASRQLRLSSRRAKLAVLAALVATLVSLVSLTGSWSLIDLRAYDYLSILGRPPRRRTIRRLPKSSGPMWCLPA
ncbi:hypothetical protein, partial [Sinorhizobium meliloti]|uniref:hypothetical protein n=1 Tax=Rhizobium meliloti TaxID=382 RepID=UPI00398A36CA